MSFEQFRDQCEWDCETITGKDKYIEVLEDRIARKNKEIDRLQDRIRDLEMRMKYANREYKGVFHVG